MGVTIREVAEAAGVSTATVSRALRGLPYVDDATRQRVLDAASALDYVVSPSASRLASGRSGTIAVVTPYIARWFFATVMSGVEEVTSEAGLDLLLTVVGEEGGRQHAPIEQRLRQRADGAIVVALPTDNPDVRQILEAGIPASLVGSMVSGVPGVAIDDVETARTATRHLVNLGHRSIGLISGDPGGSTFTVQHQRQRGYAETLAAAGLANDPSLTAYGEFTQDGGERAMVRLLSGATMPTAVVCMSDEMAFGALIALRRHGLVAGVDISVIGIDGHPQAEVADLTTVEQPVAHMGRLAAEALMAHVARGSEPLAVTTGIVPTELVVRGSTAAPRTT